ncbi:hypothetical protein HDU67_005220, partial [Dinochytrium kinnereticum]
MAGGAQGLHQAPPTPHPNHPTLMDMMLRHSPSQQPLSPIPSSPHPTLDAQPAVARLPIKPLTSLTAPKPGPGTHPDGTPMTPEELFRKLDDELERLNFDDITVSELKEHLRVRGLPCAGKKALLVQRLQDEILL